MSDTPWIDKNGDFRPNELTAEAIDTLPPWQLLVAACHFGPTMGDCRRMDYRYSLRGEEIFCGDISLKDDIDMKEPMDAIRKYALGQGSWGATATAVLTDALKEEA